jgi:ATP-dependent DNA helicase RecQ
MFMRRTTHQPILWVLNWESCWACQIASMWFPKRPHAPCHSCQTCCSTPLLQQVDFFLYATSCYQARSIIQFFALTATSLLLSGSRLGYPRVVSTMASLKRKADIDEEPAGQKRPPNSHLGQRDVQSALGRFFPRHHGFKPGQEQVITALLSGDNAAAIFPTGGGKSLCYQLPALVLHERNEGMTLVVSPLLALMKDQVDSLKESNHAADLLASSLTLDEKTAVQRRARQGETAILYVAPEQLNNEATLALIRNVKISLIAIDEAHCISEWGNSFRPDYLRLSKLCTDWKVPRVVALTATATPQVTLDICRGFNVAPRNCVRTAFYRPNLKFQFQKVGMSDRFDALVTSIRRQPPGDMIVYCTLQKTTQEVADQLKLVPGFEARPYHAGLTHDVRKETQDWFMTNNAVEGNDVEAKYRFVVATIAFGTC